MLGAAPRIGVVGAGIGGLAAAISLASKGCRVTLFERAAVVGGKLHDTRVAGQPIDSGPTVFTWPEIFEELFEEAGEDFGRCVQLKRAEVLARHWWHDGATLDLHADSADTACAIGQFAGAREARGYRDFIRDAARVFAILEHTYMRAPRPSLPQLIARIGLNPAAHWALQPFGSLHARLRRYFRDPRLQQLFGRYATYCGSSPYACPATLMLIASLEQRGVWYLQGGMRALATALLGLAQRRGCLVQTRSEVRTLEASNGRVTALHLASGERHEFDAIVSNVDNAALAAGLLGGAARSAVARERTAQRSLSAATLCSLTPAGQLPLAHHNVFFSRDYRQEFAQLARGRMPADPTVYVCAQDRCDSSLAHEGSTERLFCLINAPARGDQAAPSDQETLSCTRSILETLQSFGLNLRHGPHSASTPAQFNQRFPATGGALYGPATHGWQASFRRPSARSRLPGLYLTGGSTHPGPGVPMVALSGRLAAQAICQDLRSTSRFPGMATVGGTSMV